MTTSLRNHLCNRINSLKTCLWTWPVFLPEINYLLHFWPFNMEFIKLSVSFYSYFISLHATSFCTCSFGVFIRSKFHVLHSSKTQRMHFKVKEAHAVPFREKDDCSHICRKESNIRNCAKLLNSN